MSSAFCKEHTDCSQRFHFSRVDDEPQYITVASLGDHGTTQQAAMLKLDMLKTYGAYSAKQAHRAMECDDIPANQRPRLSQFKN